MYSYFQSAGSNELTISELFPKLLLEILIIADLWV